MTAGHQEHLAKNSGRRTTSHASAAISGARRDVSRSGAPAVHCAAKRGESPRRSGRTLASLATALFVDDAPLVRRLPLREGLGDLAPLHAGLHRREPRPHASRRAPSGSCSRSLEAVAQSRRSGVPPEPPARLGIARSVACSEGRTSRAPASSPPRTAVAWIEHSRRRRRVTSAPALAGRRPGACNQAPESARWTPRRPPTRAPTCSRWAAASRGDRAHRVKHPADDRRRAVNSASGNEDGEDGLLP